MSTLSELIGFFLPCCIDEENEYDLSSTQNRRRNSSPSGHYTQFDTNDEDETDTTSSSSSPRMHHRNRKKKLTTVVDNDDIYQSPTPFNVAAMSDIAASPITASTSNSNLLHSLNADSIILPGSDLQAAIALSLSGVKVDGVEECVICMGEFDHQNPQMLSLCDCGMNKTLFHYQCLLEWMSKDRNCPSCRSELLWEERGGVEEEKEEEEEEEEERRGSVETTPQKLTF